MPAVAGVFDSIEEAAVASERLQAVVEQLEAPRGFGTRFILQFAEVQRQRPQRGTEDE